MDVVRMPVRGEYIRLVRERGPVSSREPCTILQFKPKTARKPEEKIRDWLELVD